MIDPQIVLKLKEIPEFGKLLVHIQEECRALNRLDDINMDMPIPLSIELKARQRAYEKLSSILSPLLEAEEFVKRIDPNEYVV